MHLCILINYVFFLPALSTLLVDLIGLALVRLLLTYLLLLTGSKER